MGTLLIACPACSCHAFARETHCPGCGAPLRESDGSIQRTAGAVLLGLSLTVSTAACAPEVRPGPGAGGASSETGMGGYQVVSAYGVGPTTTGGGFDGGSPSGMGGYQAVSAYGAGPTFSGGNGSSTTSGGGGTTTGGGNDGGP